MSILKDAASLAVYGSRAANGIIMVKTKQGGKGKIAVTYSFNAEFSQPTMMMEKTRAYDYAVHQNLVRENDFLSPTFDDTQLQAILNQTDPYNLADTDWQDLALKNFAPQVQAFPLVERNQPAGELLCVIGRFRPGELVSFQCIELQPL